MSILDNFSRKRFVLIAGLMAVFALGMGMGALMFGLHGPAVAQNIPDNKPAFVRQGDHIFVPEGSSLRSRLAVQQTTVKNSPRVLQLPAMVEADPARTINILPPLAGRVVKLNIRLGDRVVKDQRLVVIDSADLSQAFADDDKARTALEHSKCCLERARGVHQAGGGSLKDLEQAQSDYEQAQAEFNRAEARLREIGVQPKAHEKSRLLTIVAPVTGTVTALTTASGAFANDPNASLMTISNLDSVWVTKQT